MKICVIEGDGIGQEVVPAALQVLQTVLPQVDVHHCEAGWDYFQRSGQSLTEETVTIARSCGAVLFGAASSPSYPVEGYFSPIVRLRRVLNTHANIRPTHYLPVPTSREQVSLIVVRENTEDVYGGVETVDESGEHSVAQKIITRAASAHIAKTAFELARLTRRRRITIIHKANVLPKTDGLFRRVAYEVSADYPEIETDDMLVDTAAYWMVKDPTRFDILLTSNQYGDILSDMAAAWGGGLGLAPALNLGDDVAIAEPVHGSAPDIAGRGIANPTAAILSTAMLIRYYWHFHEVADRIWEAVRHTLRSGCHTADIAPDGAVTTQEFTVEVCDYLRRNPTQA